MVAPIRKLQSGAQKIGAGDLAHRIHVATGDELEELAEQFNHMGAQLQASYADLERRIAERTRDLEAANQAKSRFLAAASHDLRQPIHALGLLAAQLDASGGAVHQKALIAQIESGIATLGDLFDDLLDISKLEAGAVVAQCEDFAISAVLSAISTQFAPEAREKGLKFKVLPNDAYVRSDPVLLQRILLNFVSNAVRYTERGGVLVGSRASRTEPADRSVGYRLRHSRRVQERYLPRVRATRQPESGSRQGIGVGTRHRRATRAAARQPRRAQIGTRKRLDVRDQSSACPTPATSDAVPFPRYHDERSHVARLRGVFAIVVDDDENARTGMKGLLERWECLVLAAGSAAETLTLLAQHERVPELIICDYHLSKGENGIEAIRRIRAACDSVVPAILVTGDASSAGLRAAKDRTYTR